MKNESLPSVDPAPEPSFRTPKAAAVAGIAFSLITLGVFGLLWGSIPFDLRDPGGWLPTNSNAVALALNMVPFAGISFLWFIGVLRDRIGRREDRFFATVFFGSGLLFVALLFAAAAVATTPTAQVDFLGGRPPSVESVTMMRALSYTLLFAFGTRGAAVFMLATATIGSKSGTFPRWFAVTSYVLGAALLVAVSFADWVILVLPVWVAVVSVFILRRERSRRPPYVGVTG